MRVRRLSFIVLALAACSERTAQVRSDLDAAAAPLVRPAALRVSSEPVLVRSLETAVPHLSSDTLPWTDSAIRGDTTFLTRGRAITTTSVVTDSQWIHVAAPPRQKGVPFGLAGTWDGTDLRPGTEVLTLTYGAERPGTILSRIAYARSRGIRMVTTMTGGARARYLTDGVFDMEKWKEVMDRFNAPDIKAAIAQAVADGTLIGNVVMDEPFNEGGRGNENNSWGPRGTMTKARVDSMCGYAKTLFPTLPEGVFHDYSLAKETPYRVCDFITSQYRTRKGSLEEYRKGALELCKRDHIACSFAINVLDGGTPVKKFPGQSDYAPGDCPLPSTGGKGTYFPNCRMTPDQVREAGKVLGPAGCFLTGFRYDADFVANPENQEALREVATMLATRPADPCVRR